MAPKIKSCRVPFFKDSEVCQIALGNIANLTFIDLHAHNPNTFMALGRRVRSYTGLKSCNRLIKGFTAAGLDINDLPSKFKMPDDLAEVLVRTIVPQNLRFYLSGCS